MRHNMKSGDFGQKALMKINQHIDEWTRPSQMTPEEVLDFLECLQSNLEGRIDGLRNDTTKNQ